MSYENAPATKMLATECAICSRPLLDAKSVEIGIGPTCREKYGYNELDGLSEEARQEANKLIHQIACDQGGAAVIPSLHRLMELGCKQVVRAIVERIALVKIAIDTDGRYGVKAPYSEEAVGILRGVPGRRWDKERKINTFPEDSKRALMKALCIAYPHVIAVGPKGLFILRIERQATQGNNAASAA